MRVVVAVTLRERSSAVDGGNDNALSVVNT